MNLCSDGHEEVCYEARTCPACEAIQEKQNDIDDRDTKIKDLQGQVEDLEIQLTEREEQNGKSSTHTRSREQGNQ